jgi:hypothetical protein
MANDIRICNLKNCLRLAYSKIRFDALSFQRWVVSELQSFEVQSFNVGSYSMMSRIQGLVFRVARWRSSRLSFGCAI